MLSSFAPNRRSLTPARSRRMGRFVPERRRQVRPREGIFRDRPGQSRRLLGPDSPSSAFPRTLDVLQALDLVPQQPPPSSPRRLEVVSLLGLQRRRRPSYERHSPPSSQDERNDPRASRFREPQARSCPPNNPPRRPPRNRRQRLLPALVLPGSYDRSSLARDAPPPFELGCLNRR